MASTQNLEKEVNNQMGQPHKPTHTLQFYALRYPVEFNYAEAPIPGWKPDVATGKIVRKAHESLYFFIK